MKNLEKFVLNKGTAVSPELSALGKRVDLDSVTLVYVPIGCGGPHRGTIMGPSGVRVAELSTRLQSMGLKVAQEVEIPVPPTPDWISRAASQPKCLPQIREVSQRLADAVENALAANTIPITIGGDHSIAIGSIAGVSAYYRKRQEKFGLAWFDAHGDINTPETSLSGNVHGMPFAVGLGFGDKELVNLGGFSPKLNPERCALIGVRDLDEAECKLLRQCDIKTFSMDDVDALGMAQVCQSALETVATDVSGLHVSFDIDVMDPSEAPGVSTPSPGGLNFRESRMALSMMASSGLVRSIDIAEINPARDTQNRTAEIAVKLVMTCLGSRLF